MSSDDETILMIKGAIADLPPEKRAKCEEFKKLINDASVGHEECMMLVIALIGAMFQKEAA